MYADSLNGRDEWVNAIRNAKASLFVTLSATHPNTTLTSSASNAHLRRSLQALPHAPGEESSSPRRGHVEHYVPAVWIPDAKTDACMRCGKAFGWRRRRHHCRLCGRCVCSGCSGSVCAFHSFTDIVMLTCFRPSSLQTSTARASSQVNPLVHVINATRLSSRFCTSPIETMRTKSVRQHQR